MPLATTIARDCAIALAIPLTRAEWLADVAPGSGREYAKFYCSTRPRTPPEQVWASLYKPFEATPILARLRAVERLGVEIVTRCSLADLGALTRRKQVVIVAAHWRSGLVYRDDVLDVDRFLDLLATEPTGILAALRQRMPPSLQVAVAARRPRADEPEFTELLATLNGILGSTRLATEPAANEARWPRGFILAENRAALNRACGDALDATVGLELGDETHSGDQVAAAISPVFDGVLDLTVCFSMILAEQIKRKAPGCLVLANREMTASAIRLAIACETLRMLSKRPASYINVSMAIRERLQGSRSMR
jgi:hypothetical protein